MQYKKNMKDIENRDYIIQLVDAFYEKLLKDPAMIPVFEPSMINWNEHIERVYNFWDNWLFQTGSYHWRIDVGTHRS